MNFDFDPDRAALLTIDMNKAFLGDRAPLEVPKAIDSVPRIKRLLETCRERRIPVINVSHVFRKDGRDRGLMYKFWPVLEEGTEGTEIHLEIAPIDGETVITKHR